ncbi:MAG: hypothetical protein DRH57_03260 [Candidatus Cloacimonadota bacterium]|nr:MAG: hypothetical protein DRH57_03260 [Candidatus Cloacimonadota bacterium]
MIFANSNILILLIIVPILVFSIWISIHKKRRLLAKFANANLWKYLLPNMSVIRKYIKGFLLILAISILILASARPQWGKKLQIVERRGIDIVVAIDVSKSMLATDIKPNRITRAKDALSAFIDGLSGDRIGIVTFAGTGFVQCPLTSDYSAAKMFIKLIDVGLIPTPGTNIAKAIEKSLSLFTDEQQKYRVIVLITDGENLQGNIKKIASESAKDGAIIYCIGVGTSEGSPIPEIAEDGSIIGYVEDKSHNLVLSKLDETTLKDIARLTHGAYYQMTPSQSELKEILKHINMIEKKKLESKKFTRYKEQYHVFTLLALFLLVMEFLIWEKKG